MAPRDSGLDIIVAFDLGTEKFHALPMLDYANKDDFGHGQIHLDLANLEGCLCVFCDYGFPYADVWMMKEYGVKESWTKLFSVQQSRKVSGLSFSRPLVYSKNGDKFLLELNGEKLGWFNLAKKTFRSVRIRGLRQDSFDAEICVGSLVLLNDGGGRGIRGMKHREQEEKREKNNKKRYIQQQKSFLLNIQFTFGSIFTYSACCLNFFYIFYHYVNKFFILQSTW